VQTLVSFFPKFILKGVFMRNYSGTLLDPEKIAIAIIDHQPQMYFGVESAPRSAIINNTVLLAKSAAVFSVPCLLTTVVAKTFSGYLIQNIQKTNPKVLPIDRTCINAWEDVNFKRAVTDSGRKEIILAGLWTEACVTFPALSMIADGYKVYVAVDACGGASKTAHKMAISRMLRAGVIPLTSQQILLELQRDWNNKDTYNQVMTIIKEHGGAYGLGVEYTETMLKA
jgi:nicotinamidase-related amidase